MAEQLGIFAMDRSEQREEFPVAWTLFIDGAARNNPGPAGVGIYIEKDGQPFARHGYFIGSKTNNQAEYTALLFGVALVRRHMDADDVLTVNSDSELLVRQIRGVYKVKNPDLKILYEKVLKALQGCDYTIHHVVRAHNAIADSLANKGIDTKKAPPVYLKELVV